MFGTLRPPLGQVYEEMSPHGTRDRFRHHGAVSGGIAEVQFLKSGEIPVQNLGRSQPSGPQTGIDGQPSMEAMLPLRASLEVPGPSTPVARWKSGDMTLCPLFGATLLSEPLAPLGAPRCRCPNNLMLLEQVRGQGLPRSGCQHRVVLACIERLGAVLPRRRFAPCVAYRGPLRSRIGFPSVAPSGAAKSVARERLRVPVPGSKWN